MADNLRRFSKRARRSLAYAQEEARRLNHPYIGTEHLLLGLVREENSVAARVLRSLGVEADTVRSAVEEIIGSGEQPVISRIGLSPRTKRIIELAVSQAREMGNNYIGTEHILLGLVRENEGVAARILLDTLCEGGLP